MRIQICLAGAELAIELQHPENARCFARFPSAGGAAAETLSVPEEEAAAYPQVAPSGRLDAAAERYLLIPRVSGALLKRRATLFHAAAFLWHGRAWLFAARSGVGKTTQLGHWLRLYGDEVRIINGDKPLLAVCEGGGVCVGPSPWNGKENLFGSAEDMLGGVLLLRQAQHDAIRRLSPAEAALPILERFLAEGETEEELRAMCRVAEAIVQSAPVWELENRGGEEAARLTHDALCRYEESGDEAV